MLETLSGLTMSFDAKPLAWTLVHFLWQGTLIGAASFFALRLLGRKGADVRYGVALAGLALMAAAPLATFAWLSSAARSAEPAPALSAAAASASGVEQETAVGLAGLLDAGAAAGPLEGFNASWLVAAWLLGVVGFAIAHTGGLLKVHGLRRRARPAGEGLHILRRLSSRLGLRQDVALLESDDVDSPLVIGLLKPVVLVPPAAFAGLAPQQLEAILLHELAHIRRHDYWVNLLQVMLETLLFYHPAVWWLSRETRELREHCCDDFAVEMLGEPLVYAQALAAVEELRPRPPAFSLGSGGGSLVRRIKRIVRADRAGAPGLDETSAPLARRPPARRPPAQGLASTTFAALLAAAVAALGSVAIGSGVSIAQPASEAAESPEQERAADSWIDEEAAALRSAAAGTAYAGLEDRRFRQLARWGFEPETFSALEDAGLVLEAADLEDLARHGFDADDLRELRAQGLPLDGPTLREMARHGLDGEDVAEWRDAGYAELSIADMLQLARQGVDGDDAAELAAAGYGRLSKDELLKLARVGVDGGDAAALAEAGLSDLTVDELARLARHGVDGEDVAEWRDAGYTELDLEEILRLSRHGLDADDAAELAAAGYANLSTDELMRLARRGVDGDDVQELRQAGLGELSIDQLENLARHGVDGDDVQELRAAGLGELSIDQIVALARYGVDGDDVQELREAGLEGLSVEQVLALARHGIGGDEVEEARAAGHAVDVDSLLSLARSGELWHDEEWEHRAKHKHDGKHKHKDKDQQDDSER